MAELKAHPKTGLVPVRMKVSEAGFGIIEGEIRGVAPEIAKTMIARGHAEYVAPTVEAEDRPSKKAAE